MDTSKSAADWRELARKIMVELCGGGQTFSADDLVERCLLAGVPSEIIRRFAGPLFKEFQARGKIKKVGYQLSRRNGSAAIASWSGTGQINPLI